MLWQRNDRIVLEANPDYRVTRFSTISNAAGDAAVIAALQGKTLPRIGRIDIRIMEEQQARVLGFLNREFDYLEPLPAPLTSMALTDGKLKPALQARGIVLSTVATLRTFYLWMNLEDPVLGGYTPDRIALRRAISLAYDQKEDIRVLDHGMAIAAQSPRYSSAHDGQRLFTLVPHRTHTPDDVLIGRAHPRAMTSAAPGSRFEATSTMPTPQH